jgi:hypothetical protein
MAEKNVQWCSTRSYENRKIKMKIKHIIKKCVRCDLPESGVIGAEPPVFTSPFSSSNGLGV